MAMEHQLIMSYLLSLMILIIFSVFLVVKLKTNGTKPKRPPGPWRLPIIGNMHQLFGSLPHHSLRDLANKYGPVMSIQVGEISNVVISSPEAAKQVLKTHDLIFADRPFVLGADIILYNGKDIAFGRYGDYWRQARKISVLELLSAKRVQSFRQDREAEVSRIVSRIRSSARSPINLSRMLISMTTSIISRTAFGILNDQTQDFLAPIVAKVMIALSGFTLANVFPSVKILPVITGAKSMCEKLHKDLDSILDSVINEHIRRRSLRIGTNNSSRSEARSIVQVLLDLQENGNNLETPLTIEAIKAIILDLFLAGNDTSSSVTVWAMSEMIKNPKVMRKAQEEVRKVYGNTENIDETKIHELKYLNLVIKEALRLHPPGPLLVPRESREHAEINGYEVPAKTRILINVWAIGRDPKYWEGPERFYPERFIGNPIDYKGKDFEFLPFGSGRRMCPGISFGIVIVELTLANLLYHFDWILPGEHDPATLDMTEAFGISARKKEELCLIPIPYQPPSVAF